MCGWYFGLIYKKENEYVFDKLNIKDESHVVCILTNNPFIDSELIREGYRIAKSGEFKTIALDTVKVDSDYIFYRQLYKNDGVLKFHYPIDMKNSGVNRQTDLPKNLIFLSASFKTTKKDKTQIEENIKHNGQLPQLRRNPVIKGILIRKNFKIQYFWTCVEGHFTFSPPPHFKEGLLH